MTENPDTEQRPSDTGSVECLVEGCSKPIKAAGLCGTHYQRKRRTGSADTVRKPGPQPRDGRDPLQRSMFRLYAIGTASKRSESRYHRTNRIIDYLAALAEEQYGCRANSVMFNGFLERLIQGRKSHFPNFAGELEHAEILLAIALDDPELWLETVNEVCAEQRAKFVEAGIEPYCEGNHG
jgi:hypothetical protein